MRVIAHKIEDLDTWAELKATRKLLDTKGEADLFEGKDDGFAVAMVPNSVDQYLMIVVEFDPSLSEILFSGYGQRFEEIVDRIWTTVHDYLLLF